MTRRRSTTKPTPAPPEYPKVIETFWNPRYRLDDLENKSPSCINGEVEIRKYRITVEVVEEPVEVLRERLLTLWRTSEPNHHRWDPMRKAGAALGLTRNDLKPEEQGSLFKRKP